MIGGNQTAILQIKQTQKNVIGESEMTWIDAYQLTGWLDLSNGDSTSTYNAKIQESTHIFLCDYDELIATNDNQTIQLTSENSRMVINNQVYDIKLIDDPMGMHEHLEIYLKYIGGGLGV